MFSGLPVQLCHFHQVAIIKRYLTSKPKFSAGVELWRIALTLAETTEKKFVKQLDDWHQKRETFLKEKTINPITGKWFYTHKRVRSADRSLKTNLPYLFTPAVCGTEISKIIHSQHYQFVRRQL